MAAEPPQEDLPYGRWAQRLASEFMVAVTQLVPEEGDELGEPGEITWYPDRTWHGFTYVPATCATAGGFELLGYVRFRAGGDESEPSDFSAIASYTEDLAAENPDWQIDLCDEQVGSWRGVGGRPAAMTLVWGRPLRGGGQFVAGELAGVLVDACPLVSERFTLIAPDDFAGDLLEVVLYDGKGQELAREALHDPEDEQDGQ
jgi:hypothetical protein